MDCRSNGIMYLNIQEISVKAFVTGATGFIGRSLVNRLLEKGFKVTALARNKDHGLPDDVRVVYGDILEVDSLKALGKGCDILFHLSGMISFDPAKEEVLTRVNGQGTGNILKMAFYCDIEKTVVVSSACTFGISFTKDLIIDESSVPESQLWKRNPYMKSKMDAEDKAMKASENQYVVIVNPTTVYGAGDSALNSGTLIKRIYQSKILPVPPGGCNVIDVTDVSDGIIQASIKGKTGRKYILAGSNQSFASLFSVISDVTNNHPILVPLYRWMRPAFSAAVVITGKITGNRFFTRQIADDMFAYKYYSNIRAQEELDWSPKCSFSASVREAFVFYKREGLM